MIIVSPFAVYFSTHGPRYMEARTPPLQLALHLVLGKHKSSILGPKWSGGYGGFLPSVTVELWKKHTH